MGPSRVRIWYRSEGNEVLACDSLAMSDAAAVAFRRRILKGDHDVIGAEVFTDNGPATPPGVRTFRLVTKPTMPPRATSDGNNVGCPECDGAMWTIEIDARDALFRCFTCDITITRSNLEGWRMRYDMPVCLLCGAVISADHSERCRGKHAPVTTR